MKSNLKQINAFLACKNMAIVGASRDPKKFGNQVLAQLVSKGFTVFPVHRQAEEINCIRCYRDIQALPVEVEALCLITPKQQTDDLIRMAINKGIRNIWVQQFSEGSETNNLVNQEDAQIVTGRCIFMYLNPTGLHKFHERMSKIFGVYAH
ncbi:MAG: CoA-binding protein [Bacteroidales bacterium]|nr:CoA-binding protein [Bacteroidales bacterium]